MLVYCYFFFNDTATTEIYTLSLHDALPIYNEVTWIDWDQIDERGLAEIEFVGKLIALRQAFPTLRDRKSTRLNSSHPSISYAVFCLKKKKQLRACFLFLQDNSYVAYRNRGL